MNHSRASLTSGNVQVPCLVVEFCFFWVPLILALISVAFPLDINFKLLEVHIFAYRFKIAGYNANFHVLLIKSKYHRQFFNCLLILCLLHRYIWPLLHVKIIIQKFEYQRLLQLLMGTVALPFLYNDSVLTTAYGFPVLEVTTDEH